MMLVCSCVCLRFRQWAFSAKAVTTVMFCHLLSAELDDLGILQGMQKPEVSEFFTQAE